MAEPKKSRNQSIPILVILLLLLLGILCTCLAGTAATELPGIWRANADVGSKNDPNIPFFERTPELLAPVSSNILTSLPWEDTYQTPGVVIPTIQVVTTQTSFSTPQTAVTTPTSVPTLQATVTTPTSIVTPQTTPTTVSVPTSTSVLPPPPPPPPPSDVPVDLQITKTDGQPSYLAGSTITYSITVKNNSSNNVSGAIIKDNKPSQVSTWGWSSPSFWNGLGPQNRLLGAATRSRRS